MIPDEVLLHRVIYGRARLRVCGLALVVLRPTPSQLCSADEAYLDRLESARLSGAYTEESLLEFLKRHRLWDDARQAELDSLAKDVEECKVGLARSGFRSREREAIRAALETKRARRSHLLGQRHAYDHLGAEGSAAAARARHLFARTVRPRISGRHPAFEAAMSAWMASRPSEAQLRSLARSQTWRAYWSVREHCRGVFGVPAASLSEEQASLLAWSQAYDGARSHPECPAEWVFGDDDAFDGWLILQGRKAKASAAVGDGLSSCDEIYHPAETPEDAALVDSLNDEHAAAVKKARFAEIEKKGVVEHLNLSDVRQWAKMEAAKLGA